MTVPIPILKGTNHENDTNPKTGHRIDRPHGPLLTGIGLVEPNQYNVASLARWMVGRFPAHAPGHESIQTPIERNNL